MRIEGGRVAVLLAVVAAGCAGVTPRVVPEQQVPEAFSAQHGRAPSLGNLNWREYFQAPLLHALVSEALEHNQDLAIALQRVERARAELTRATGALFPRLDATLGAGVRKFGRYTMDGAGNATTEMTAGVRVPEHLGDYAVGLQASWEVDVWGKLRSERQATAALVAASEETVRLATTALVAEVATGWFDLVALGRAAEVVQEAVRRQEEALEVVRLQKTAGRASELAVQQFEAQLAETRALAVETSQRAVEVEGALNLLLGRFPRPIERQPLGSFEPLRPIEAGLPAELLRNRPDVREAEHLVKAAQFDLKAAQAAFFPSLNLGAGVGLQAFNPAFLLRLPESLAYSALGGLVAPLVNRAAIEARFQGAQAAQLEAVYGYQKVVLTAFIEVTTGLSAVEATGRLVALKQEQKAAVERSVETADLLFRAGKAAWLEVLLAQQVALRSELELVEAWRQQRVAAVTTYRALGGGWR